MLKKNGNSQELKCGWIGLIKATQFQYLSIFFRSSCIKERDILKETVSCGFFLQYYPGNSSLIFYIFF